VIDDRALNHNLLQKALENSKKKNDCRIKTIPRIEKLLNAEI